MKSRYKKKRIVFVTLSFAISLVALFFVIVNFRDSIVFFYSPSELLRPEILERSRDRQIKIGGMVEKGGVKKIDALTTEFVVTDFKKRINVVYSGILPDLFREGQGVVAKGKFDEKKQEFVSRELLIKHDEKYMPPEVADALKNQPTESR